MLRKTWRLENYREVGDVPFEYALAFTRKWISPEGVDTAFKPEKGAGSDTTSLALVRSAASAVYSEMPPSPSSFVALMYRTLVLLGPAKTTSEMLESVLHVDI